MLKVKLKRAIYNKLEMIKKEFRDRIHNLNKNVDDKMKVKEPSSFRGEFDKFCTFFVENEKVFD